MFKIFRLKRPTTPGPSTLLLTAIIGLIAPVSQAAEARLTFGTGGKGGYYFQVGDLLCKSFAADTTGYACRNRSTKGPTENLPKLRAGKFDIIVVRSDWAKQALDGKGYFRPKGADSSLRSLFSLHSEPLTIVTRKNSGINDIGDLSGNRVRLGRSATHLVQQIPQSKNWDVSAFKTIKPNETKAQGSALCAGKIDAIAAVVGYPSGQIQKIAQSCPIQLIKVTGPEINRMISGSKALSPATIPANVYVGLGSPTKTFGYKATLLSSAEVPDNDVYAFVKNSFESLPELARQHPAFNGLKPSAMIRDSLPAPLHPGAERYYREQGWIK